MRAKNKTETHPRRRLALFAAEARLLAFATQRELARRRLHLVAPGGTARRVERAARPRDLRGNLNLQRAAQVGPKKEKKINLSALYRSLLRAVD